MQNLSVLVGAYLTMGLIIPVWAQEVPDNDTAVDDRIDALKAELIDVTPGYYVSPALTVSGVVADLEQGGLEADADGYVVRGGLSVGYQANPVRIEVGANIGRSEVEIDFGGGLVQDRQITTYDVSFTTFYDVPVNLGSVVDLGLPAIVPFVGAGVGYIYLDPNDAGGDGGLSGQFTAGVGTRLLPRLTLDIGYRYFYLPRIDFDGADTEANFNTVEGRLRYRF